MEKQKILVIDDEEQILDLIKKKLLASDYDCLVSPAASQAAELAKDYQPNLILLDIAMPEKDGYSVAKDLKKQKETKDIPIIFLTGKALEPRAIEERVGAIGAYDYAMKPTSLKELLEKIKTAIG